MIKKFLGIIMVLFFASSAFAANFYWKDTFAGLDALTDSSGDRGVVIDSSGLATFYYNTGSGWIVSSLTGGVTVVSKSAAYTLGTDNPAEAYGGMFFNTATMTLTLPEVTTTTVGMNFCAEVVGNYTLTIDPNANDGIILTDSSGTRGTNGNYISNTSASTGDMICLITDSASGWATVGSRGTWAAQ